MSILLALLPLLSAPALAQDCAGMADKASKLKGEALANAFAKVVACDRAVAEDRFGVFVRASGDVPTLVDLSLRAIDGELYPPVWGLLDKVPDYPARAEIAQRVGALCQDRPGVLPFLQGAYYAVGGRQFTQWSPALVSCVSTDMGKWLEAEVAKPPERAYDEKYIAMVDAHIAKAHHDALPALERAAVASSSSGGPFSTLIEKLHEAARPAKVGAKMTEADTAALVGALTRVGNAVAPEQAALIADRLHQAGATVEAAALLPRVYPSSVQSDGSLLYGVIAVESCNKQAVLHTSVVREPAKRWVVQDAVERPARSVKPRLKCQVEGRWPVFTTPEPISDRNALSAWVATVVAQWEAQGLDVKTRSEKDIVLD